MNVKEIVFLYNIHLQYVINIVNFFILLIELNSCFYSFVKFLFIWHFLSLSLYKNSVCFIFWYKKQAFYTKNIDLIRQKHALFFCSHLNYSIILLYLQETFLSCLLWILKQMLQNLNYTWIKCLSVIAFSPKEFLKCMDNHITENKYNIF